MAETDKQKWARLKRARKIGAWGVWQAVSAKELNGAGSFNCVRAWVNDRFIVYECETRPVVGFGDVTHVIQAFGWIPYETRPRTPIAQKWFVELRSDLRRLELEQEVEKLAKKIVFYFEEIA